MATKKELEDKIAFLELELNKYRDQAPREPEAKVVDIVYPNVAHLAQWEEFKYSVRSIEKNLRGVAYRIWVVGDFPKWANGKLRHIPCEFTRKTPRIDVLHKHQAVIDNQEIGEEYFWMNDDIYFVNPVYYADMCMPVAINNFNQSLKRMNKQTVWGKDNIATFGLLNTEKLTTWNYAAHIPHRFEKKKVQLLAEKFDMFSHAIVLEQIYYNYWFKEYQPYIATLDLSCNLGFSVNRPNPNTASMRAQLKVKKWMNNGEAGMSPILQNCLIRMFTEKSSFEL